MLASTCLTAAAGAASASTFTEGTDFTAFPTATPLPAGTTQVMGSIGGSDFSDYFQVPSLIAGDNYLVSLSSASGSGISLQAYTSSNGLLGSSVFQNGSTNVAAPGDQIINFRLEYEGSAGAYTVTLADTSVPEPSTGALMGLAAASLMARRRKK